MIIIHHNHLKVTKIIDVVGNDISFPRDKTIPEVLKDITKVYPEVIVVWCHQMLANNINYEKIEHLFHHKKMFLSYQPGEGQYLGSQIGYIEETPFIRINTSVRYPTWQMSSLVGVTSSQVLNAIGASFYKIKSFSYFLQSVAKYYMPLGLMCYSEPQLLKQNQLTIPIQKASTYQLFKFVKEHYRWIWVWGLALDLVLYEKRLPLFPLFYSLLFSKLHDSGKAFDFIQVQSSNKVIESGTIDVIIPTIGRKDYLYDVMNDLRKQTHLPEKVIIIEQNPDLHSVSELDYLSSETWPFKIEHIFTHRAGACHARNLALSKVTAEWVFLNDDDNRFEQDLIQRMFVFVERYGIEVATSSYLQPNEQKKYSVINQTPIFGSGNSFLRSRLLNEVAFDSCLEFGYGEDVDFGLQLRNIGADVLYFPNLDILHLKAPRGGFRTKFAHPWENDPVQPKPSPTLMYVMKKFNTDEQLLGYKTRLCFKFYKFQNIRNPLKYLKNYRLRWRKSLEWANRLKLK